MTVSCRRPIRECEVIVNYLDLDEWKSEEATLKTILNRAEIEKMNQYRFPGQAARFGVCRAYLRLLVGMYLDIKPRDIEIGVNKYGKPILVNEHNNCDLQFNVSHTGKLAVVAVMKNRQIGVDVEQVLPISDLVSIASQVFTPHENVWLFSDDNSVHNKRFFRLWTCKEALLKAVGTGFLTDPKSIEVSSDFQRDLACQRWVTKIYGKQYTCVKLSPPLGTSGTLVVLGNYTSGTVIERTLSYRELSEIVWLKKGI